MATFQVSAGFIFVPIFPQESGGRCQVSGEPSHSHTVNRSHRHTVSSFTLQTSHLSAATASHLSAALDCPLDL